MFAKKLVVALVICLLIHEVGNGAVWSIMSPGDTVDIFKSKGFIGNGEGLEEDAEYTVYLKVLTGRYDEVTDQVDENEQWVSTHDNPLSCPVAENAIYVLEYMGVPKVSNEVDVYE